MAAADEQDRPPRRKIRSPQGRRRGPARRPRPPAAQPDAGQLPARAASLRGGGRARGGLRGGGAGARSGACSTSASSARSRRSTTRARSATARCWSRRRSIPSTRGAPRKIINSHPGVSHNYLRNHEFNMWFTIAVERDSKLGLRRARSTCSQRADRRRVDPPAADAASCSRSAWTSRWRATPRRSPAPARGQAPAPLEAQPYDERDVAVIRATQGDMPVVAEPYAPAAARARDDRGGAARAHAGMRERGLLRRVAAILFHRRAGFSANGMGVWKVPDGADRRARPADGLLPRHLALLPAPDLRGLALLGLHDGPRALQGGVRRGARRDRRARPGSRSARRCTPRPSSRRSGCCTSPTTSSDWEARARLSGALPVTASLTDTRSAELYRARARRCCRAASTRRCARCARSAATRCSSSAARAPSSSTSTATATSTTSAPGAR